MGIFRRDHSARDAAVETARAWREYQQDQERAAREPAPDCSGRDWDAPLPGETGVFHRGPGTLDVSGRVLGTGNTVSGPEGITTTPGTPAPRRDRQAGGGGWHNDGVISRGTGQVVIGEGTVMGCGQTVTHQPQAQADDREAG